MLVNDEGTPLPLPGMLVGWGEVGWVPFGPGNARKKDAGAESFLHVYFVPPLSTFSFREVTLARLFGVIALGEYG